MANDITMIEPRIRLVAALLGIGGVVITSDPRILVAGYCFLLVILAIRREIKGHLVMTLTAFGPILVMLYVLYKYILPVRVGFESDISPFTTTLRLVNISTIVYLTLKIKPDEFPVVLRSWGLRGDALFVVMSSLISVADLTKRADRILTARMARGYFENRSFVTKIVQLPFIIRPLVAGTLLSAIERSDSWHQKFLLDKPMYFLDTVKVGWWYSSLLLLVSFLWFLTCASI